MRTHRRYWTEVGRNLVEIGIERFADVDHVDGVVCLGDAVDAVDLADAADAVDAVDVSVVVVGGDQTP